jgi:hypothetical protein
VEWVKRVRPPLFSYTGTKIIPGFYTFFNFSAPHNDKKLVAETQAQYPGKICAATMFTQQIVSKKGQPTDSLNTDRLGICILMNVNQTQHSTFLQVYVAGWNL